MERAAVPSMVREERLRRWIADYSGAVMKVCCAYLRDRAQAEDAVQDTFFKAWKHMDAYERKGIENEKAWLMRIAVNTCKDYRRSAWFRHMDGRQSLDALPEIPAQPRDGTLAMDICRLKDKYKQIILLYYYQGFTLKETADMLGISQSTAFRRLEKARESLKNSLEGDDADA